MSQPRRGGARGAVGLVAVSLILAACGGSVASPTAAPAAPSATAAPAASATPTITVAPSQPAAPGPAVPWGGLVWSEPVPAELPWGYAAPFMEVRPVSPDQVVAWHGQFYAVGKLRTDEDFEVVIARTADFTGWREVFRGPKTPTAADGSVRLVASETGLVAVKDAIAPTSPYCPNDPAAAPCSTGLQVWSSTDGETWTAGTAAPFADLAVRGAVVGPKGILIVGARAWNKPTMWHSATGSSWQAADLSAPPFKGAAVSFAVATSDGFILTGTVGAHEPRTGVDDPGGHPVAWFSDDGLHWQTAGVEAYGLAMSFHDVIPVANGFVAIGFRTGAWYSPDGRSWRAIHPAQVAGADPSSLFGSVYSDGSHGVATIGWEGDLDEQGNPPIGRFLGSVDGGTWRQLAQSGYDASAMFPKLDDRLVIVTAGGLTVVAVERESGRPVVMRAVATP